MGTRLCEAFARLCDSGTQLCEPSDGLQKLGTQLCEAFARLLETGVQLCEARSQLARKGRGPRAKARGKQQAKAPRAVAPRHALARGALHRDTTAGSIASHNSRNPPCSASITAHDETLLVERHGSSRVGDETVPSDARRVAGYMAPCSDSHLHIQNAQPVHCDWAASDHVHLLIVLHETERLCDVVFAIKRAVSRDWNQQFADGPWLDWQDGYWAQSVDGRDPERVIRYVSEQRQHHASASEPEEWGAPHSCLPARGSQSVTARRAQTIRVPRGAWGFQNLLPRASSSRAPRHFLPCAFQPYAFTSPRAKIELTKSSTFFAQISQ